MKTKTLLASIILLLAVFLAGCKKDNFNETVGVCPVVKSTDPADGAIDVPLSQVVTIIFNEKMNPATITQQSFILTGAARIPGTLTYDEATAAIHFVPAVPLTANTTYTGKVATSVKDLTGNALQSGHVWTFSTGTTLSPAVISTDPPDLATGVFLNKIISVTFSMPMDPLTLTAATFIVRHGAAVIAGSLACSGATAFFTPASPLVSGTSYIATITTGARNGSGNPLENDYSWSFTTGSVTAPTVISTDPGSNAAGVILNKIVSATFSEAMAPLTITSATFTIRQGITIVAGSVSCVGSTAFFNPATALNTNTVYTATITTGAKNLAGTPLANNYIWSFTTGSAKGPAILATDPASNATGVGLHKMVTATFNEPMDPLTINASTFTIRQGAITVPGTISSAGAVASFIPSATFIPNTVYTGTITTGAKNIAGTPLGNDYIWTFTTGSGSSPEIMLTDPASNATHVPLTKTVTATFSEAMDPLTINSVTFTLNLGTMPVAGIVAYSGTTASFKPSANLSPTATYTATITTGAMNTSGSPLPVNYVWSFSTNSTVSPPPVVLGTADRFGILTGLGISNNAGFSEIHNLDVGIYPGLRSSVTGFPPAIIVNGAIYASDDPAPVPAMLIQAKADLTAAYLSAEGATTPAPVTVSGDQGGKTLTPGIYKSTSTMLVQSGDLTLDGQGDPNATWIFQIAAGFTTVGGAGGNIILTGGAQAGNVFWQTGSSATIGDYTSFKGNILALTSITMNSHATATGRMLSINGAVVMTHTNTIDKP